jgi:hypothetical protein
VAAQLSSATIVVSGTPLRCKRTDGALVDQNAMFGKPLADFGVAQSVPHMPAHTKAMMSSVKTQRENAELERRVTRRQQRLQRKRCPPSCVFPSFVTLSELHRGQTIDCPPAVSLSGPPSCKRTCPASRSGWRATHSCIRGLASCTSSIH